MSSTTLNHPVIRDFSSCPRCFTHGPFHLLMKKQSHPIIGEFEFIESWWVGLVHMSQNDGSCHRCSNYDSGLSHYAQLCLSTFGYFRVISLQRALSYWGVNCKSVLWPLTKAWDRPCPPICARLITLFNVLALQHGFPNSSMSFQRLTTEGRRRWKIPDGLEIFR